MADQPEQSPEPASGDGDTLTWGDLMLWAVTPAAECTLDNPKYADFARRFETSRFAELMERPAGGVTFEQIVLASYQAPGAQEDRAR
jgi:hypothetical protein